MWSLARLEGNGMTPALFVMSVVKDSGRMAGTLCAKASPRGQPRAASLEGLSNWPCV